MARIIAIDDEQAILDVIERILKRDGHDVLCLADPASALKLNLARADLILCDVMMPGIDGFELVRGLRFARRSRGSTGSWERGLS